MPNFRRGAAAIKEANDEAKKKGSGGSRFVPKIFWSDDADERYVLFLNRIEDIPRVDLIGFIPQKGKKCDGSTYEYFDEVIARTDPGIDDPQNSDPLVKEWDAKPKATNIAVAVELEPTFSEVKGRKRPKGFEIKVSEYERRVRDEDGDLTDEIEDAYAPAIGFVMQSPANFGNVLESYDSTEAPIEETPLKITRVGKDNNTAYRIDGYPEQEIDLSNLIENVDGIGYLYGDDLDDLLGEIEDLDPQEAALQIGTAMLEKRLEELADDDRYEKIAATVDKSLDRFGGKSKKKKDRSSSSKPARRTQRKPKDDAPEESESEDKPARKTNADRGLDRLRKQAAKSTDDNE